MEKDLLTQALATLIMAEDAEIKFIDLCNFMDKDRINEAFDHDPNAPLIIVGLDDEQVLLQSEEGLKLRTILARPKTAYVKLPCDWEVIQKAIDGLKAVSSRASAALEAKAQIEETQKQVGYLKHLAAYRERDSAEIGQKAREQYGWEGSDEEIMARLDEFHPEREMAVQFSGETVPGVFCDVEGTLFDWNGNVRPEVVAMLEKYGDEGKAVALWSGGDPEELGQKLAANGMDRWPLLSKYDFHGCIVEVAIDDLPEEKLQEDYGIRAEVYVHHDPDGIHS